MSDDPRPLDDERQLFLDLWNDETAWMPTPANENKGPKFDIDRLIGVMSTLSADEIVHAWSLARLSLLADQYARTGVLPEGLIIERNEK